MVHVIASMTLISLMVLSMLGLSNFRDAALDRSHMRMGVMVARSNIDYIIKSGTSWLPAVRDGACNPSMQCLALDTDCFATNGGNSAPVNCLYDWEGKNVIFDSRIATQGFDLSGLPCNTFNPANPDRRCMLRPVLTWRTTCTASPCIDQPYEVEIRWNTLVYNGSTINTQDLSTVILKK